jgi:hypothetical protein
MTELIKQMDDAYPIITQRAAKPDLFTPRSDVTSGA